MSAQAAPASPSKAKPQEPGLQMSRRPKSRPSATCVWPQAMTRASVRVMRWMVTDGSRSVDSPSVWLPGEPWQTGTSSPSARMPRSAGRRRGQAGARAPGAPPRPAAPAAPAPEGAAQLLHGHLGAQRVTRLDDPPEAAVLDAGEEADALGEALPAGHVDAQ